MFSVHSWEFFLSSKEAWEAMYKACESATKSIDFEQFIFYDDTIGKKFATLLMAKARGGLEVRLLADTVGSFPFVGSELATEMKKAGVHVHYFNYINPWKVSRIRYWLFRDHRKLLIVDNKVAYIGGVGIGDKMGGWRDSHVSIEGPVVAECLEAYNHIWNISLNDKFIPYKKPRFVSGGFMLATSAPHFRQRHIESIYIEALRNARHYAYITTPYFSPDRKLFRVMILAARRGVDVRLLVPANSDHTFTNKLADAHFAKALRAGVKIYKYPTNMMHSKVIAIDDDWASIGSCNLDDPSLFFNYELTLISVQPKFAETIRTQFNDDLIISKQYLYSEWKDRPWHQIAQEYFILGLWRFGFWLLKKIFYF